MGKDKHIISETDGFFLKNDCREVFFLSAKMRSELRISDI